MLSEFNLSEYKLSARAHIEVLIARWHLEDNDKFSRLVTAQSYSPALAPKSLIRVPDKLNSIMVVCFGHMHNIKRACLYQVISLCRNIDSIPYRVKAKDFVRVWRDDFPVLAFYSYFQEDVLLKRLGYNVSVSQLNRFAFWKDLVCSKLVEGVH